MKNFGICFLSLIMILTFNACDRKGEDLPVAESVEEVFQPNVEQESNTKGEEDADTSNEFEKVDADLPQEQPDAEKQVAYPDGIQLKKVDGESYLSFDHSVVLELPMDNSAYQRADKLEKISEKTYSTVMKKVGDDGLIVAGYASGLRETHDGKYLPHTLTEFNVTDVYYGEPETSKLKISEGYSLCEEDGKFIISFFSDHLSWLENGKQVLLFLGEGSDGYLVPKFDPIPLGEDYRNYNEEYESSLLDFFRGKRSEYLNQTETNEPQELSYRVNENGEVEYYFDASSYEPTFSWPQQDASDEELLAELVENVIVRAAMDYKVVIWPYGHKNAGAGYQNGDFAKASMP